MIQTRTARAMIEFRVVLCRSCEKSQTKVLGYFVQLNNGFLVLYELYKTQTLPNLKYLEGFLDNMEVRKAVK